MPGFIIGMVVTLHVAVCVALMVAILLQSGKGGGLAGAFGAGSSQTLFGGRGAATFLSRATTALAVIFFLTSLTLGLQASRTATGRESLIQEEARKRGQQRAATEGRGAPQAPVSGTTMPESQGAPPLPEGAGPAGAGNPTPATGTTK